MSAKMEYKGQDIDEAISNACAALNVERDQIDVSIISTGSTGIFGFGRKKAAIEVRLKKEDGAEAVAAAPPEKAPRKKPKPKPKAEQAAPRPQRNEQADEGGNDVMGDPVSPEEIEAIKADLSQILSLMNCPSEINMEVDSLNKVHAHIKGGHVETLVGPEGQTLDGLQYIMRKIITRKFPQKVLFSLDAGEFRANRMQELQERAVRLAQEVKDTGKTRTIPAINPAERRIVHMALQDDTEIRSRSVGDGLFKKVLIYLPGKGRKRSPRKRRSGGDKRQQQ